jgi:hypothetical protein
LLQSLDRFAYKCDQWSYVPENVFNPLQLRIDKWTGNPIVPIHLNVISLRGCDQNPVTDYNKLRSYVWADQVDRKEALELALKARGDDVVVDKADAAVWIAQQLAQFDGSEDGVCTVVFHSVFLQYPPPDVCASIAASIAKAGAKATNVCPLVWLRFENEPTLMGKGDVRSFMLDCIVYPGGERHVLATADPHGRQFVNWLQ